MIECADAPFDISFDAPEIRHVGVTITPPDIAKRQSAAWRGIAADVVQLTRQEHFEYGYCAPRHLLIAADRGERRDGETFIEGLPSSTRHDFNRKLTFVPAGRKFRGWQEPRALARSTYLYIDPSGPLLDPELRFGEIDFQPQLFFDDAGLWDTAVKLKSQVEHGGTANRLYAEALSIVLAHELVRLHNGVAPAEPMRRGGLAGWQKNRVVEYIEENLAEPISLASLAELAQLSPFHFSRAFKQSFGLPPHRYHTARRIDLAKVLLAKPDLSVTDIALRIGYSETSSFTAVFRKLTGRTPTDYRRSLA